MHAPVVYCCARYFPPISRFYVHFEMQVVLSHSFTEREIRCSPSEQLVISITGTFDLKTRSFYLHRDEFGFGDCKSPHDRITPDLFGATCY